MRIKKKTIPKSLKENVWIHYIGENFTGKCAVEWCNKKITPFTFETGHNIPESKGGHTSKENLRPICASCNKSMGNRYSIDEYSKQFKPTAVTTCHIPPKQTYIDKQWFLRCFSRRRVVKNKVAPADDTLVGVQHTSQTTTNT